MRTMTTTALTAKPPMRNVSFDAKEHARLFRIDDLVLSVSPRGNPRLLLEAEHEGCLVRAGTITFIAAGVATLGGQNRPASLAIHGRMAEFSDEQLALIEQAGMRVVSEEGKKKTFRTIFLDVAAVPAAQQVITNLKTSNGKPCFKGSFTANAIGECVRLLRAQNAVV